MTYYTSYELEVLGAKGEPYSSRKHELIRYPQDIYDLLILGLIYGETIESNRWEWEEEMTRVSLLNPLVIFVLYGVGERLSDRWVATFSNGEVHKERAEIVIRFETIKLRSGVVIEPSVRAFE